MMLKSIVRQNPKIFFNRVKSGRNVSDSTRLRNTFGWLKNNQKNPEMLSKCCPSLTKSPSQMSERVISVIRLAHVT